ncbi:MAG: T9SS C-terminal target domain-containing protein, partial [Bacteroidetes bacterium]
FPEDLELSNLKNLFLKNNLLENLPTSFGKLNKLKILDLSNNRLKNLPESVGDFTDLEELYLNGNMLSALPNLSKTSLKVLNFAKNEIKNLPTDFGKLQNLQFVDLSLNRLTFYELAPLLNMKFANAIYDPQKTILAPSEISVKLYEDYDLESFAKNFNGNNTYIWFKNNSISTQKQENFGFRNMNKDQIGVYFCEVKNVLFPLLTLRRQETFVKLSCQGSSPILVDVSPALQVCEGETVTLSSKLSNNSEIRWLKDGKLIQNTSNNLRVFESGNYVAEVVADGCTKSSEILQVHFIKSAPILLSLNSDGYTLQANFLDKNAIFQWFVNNEIVAVTQNPVYEVIQRGIYYVKVTNVGCQSISNEVAVQKVSPTATEDEANVENMLVFPNPSHDILFLKSAENLSEIKIYDALGRCQATILPKNNAGIYEIQTEKLNSGVYFLQVKTAKGTFQKQFLKN